MRRPLLVFVLLATIAVAWVQAAFASVHDPGGNPQIDRASRAQKLARRSSPTPVGKWASPTAGAAPRPHGLRLLGPRLCRLPVGRGEIPRSSWDQLRVGRPIRFARLRPGDLLFTEGGGHVQLVVSKGGDLGPANGRARPLRPAGTAPPAVRRRAAPAQLAEAESLVANAPTGRATASSPGSHLGLEHDVLRLSRS